MLKDAFELAKNVVSKNSIIFKIFLKKIFKFFPYHWIFGFRIVFLLILLLNYWFIKKQSGKKDLIWPISSDGFKIVFILLLKTIAV